ncbi:hypothetical protein [Streptomyces sp. NPDC017529]|uniref:hypothetical protein n=1 Tax=Streptomyces sp. NPDC017529 TaxID=3365000 RepID=UPI0037A075B3
MTTLPHLVPTDIEWQLTPYNINQIDDQTDRDGIYAKGYFENVDGKTVVTGLRIGTGENRIVAKFGDTVIRHRAGKYSVRPATPEQAATYHRLTALLAEQRHQYRDLDTDSTVWPGLGKLTCPACPPNTST